MLLDGQVEPQRTVTYATPELCGITSHDTGDLPILESLCINITHTRHAE